MTDYRSLRVEVADGVALVTVDRPEVRNVLDRQVMTELRAVLGALADDDAAGAVVFTGAADTAFVAGADITEVRNYSARTALESDMQRVFDLIEDYPSRRSRR